MDIQHGADASEDANYIYPHSKARLQIFLLDITNPHTASKISCGLQSSIWGQVGNAKVIDTVHRRRLGVLEGVMVPAK